MLDLGAGYYFGAVALGGTGVRFYGEYCVVIVPQHSPNTPACSTATPTTCCLWTVGGAVDALVCVDEDAAGRPAPYLIFRAMERTGVRCVDRVLVAGDTAADLEAATNAGAAVVVGVGTGGYCLDQLAEAPHTHLLPSVAGIGDLV